jgi:penicillin G amidase
MDNISTPIKQFFQQMASRVQTEPRIDVNVRPNSDWWKYLFPDKYPELPNATKAPPPSRRRLLTSSSNLAASLLVFVLVLIIAFAGSGIIPSLGPTLNPGTGVWASDDGQLPHDQTLQIPGLNHPVQVVFESNGLDHIVASTDHDLFMTIGYLHAKFRLFQMDLTRREGEGLLSQVLGPSALQSDEFEYQLGLTQTAKENLNQANDETRQVLNAYAQGVNTVIKQEEQSNQLPVIFKMIGYQPAQWTPLDTLVIQQVLTQELDFTHRPLDYALIVKALGYDLTMKWFPIVPFNEQHPIDQGTYNQDPLVPIPQVNQSGAVSDNEAKAATAAIDMLQALPPTAVHTDSNSNGWVVDGTMTASGKPILSGDPHLAQTLPPIWFQIDAQSPGYQFSGASIPGIPVILIGHNQHISWTLTNAQHGATFYYQEKTDAAHPGQYFWHNAWQPTKKLHYSIPVKGQTPVDFTVESTVHGPIITQQGLTMSVWWIGALPSSGIGVMLNVLRANNYTQFRDALRSWVAPTQNFIYADDQGNIAIQSVGYAPQVQSGQPWLPLPGDGSADVIGTVPFDDLPHVYDPPNHFVISANQREAPANYPYYYGTSLDFYDQGYRADQIYQVLSSSSHLTVQDMERLQNDTHDYLAKLIVPKLLDALKSEKLTSQEQQVVSLLQSWDDDMGLDSAAATIWQKFWNRYVYDTFNPWWSYYHGPGDPNGELTFAPTNGSIAADVLHQDLQAWTLTDPSNPAFSLPDGTQRVADDVMRQSFATMVTGLYKSLGSDPENWIWGKQHFRVFQSLTQIPDLNYGPRDNAGNIRTVTVAGGGIEVNGKPVLSTSTAGASWRFIIDWGTSQSKSNLPGGQSENPLSPWYTNQVNDWFDGKYIPMYSANSAKKQPGIQTWTLQP